MAVESGSGLLGLTDSSNVAAALNAQAAAQSRAAKLKIEYDSLTEYRKMVEDLLDELTGSNADHKKIADNTLPAAKLGTGFPEADALHKSYTTVVTELEKLSKGLAQQIEGLGIAILSAGNGYGDVDDDTKRRMLAIAQDAEKHYDPKRDPYAEEQKKLAGTKPPAHDNGGHI